MKDERLTYLIASCDQAQYVVECLQSLREQTCDEWRAIVCDDASVDDSVDAVRQFDDDRIRLLVNPHRVGYVDTLIRLIAAAGTDIVAILDADDALTPDATERLLQTWSTHPDAGFVYSRYAAFDQDLHVCHGEFGTALGPADTALRDGVVGAIRSFRRSTYDRTAGLDPTMQYAEDRDLVYKLEEVTRLVFVDAVLYRYRELPGSQSHEPARREEGARNVLRARRQAARRRGMRGVEALLNEAFFVTDYLAYSAKRPRMVRTAASLASRVFHRLTRVVSSGPPQPH